MSDPLSLTVIRVEALTVEQRARIIELCTRAYEEDFEPLFRTFRGAIHILACLGETLVSHALWVTRWLQPQGLPLLRTAYIEAVATAPELRGRGYATMVMRKVAEQIQDFELAGLSPAETELYARLGWEYWRGPLYIRTPQGFLPTPGERVMILRLPNTPPALDLEAPLSAEWREGELW